MDWLLSLIIFVVLVVIVWWALSRQADSEVNVGHHHQADESARDDLTKIEGIGPKVQSLLNDAGVTTFSILAGTAPERLDEVLNSAGSIYKAMEKKSWPTQAALAAEGKWDELQRLQEELIGGK